MKRLWIAFIVLATLGSIYPFNFQVMELDAQTLGRFFQSCCRMPSRGDILGNIILFVPIGFSGMLAARPEESPARRFLFVCMIAFVVALALQVLQIFLPSRDENLQDIVWNMFGTAGGAALAHLTRLITPRSTQDGTNASLVPLTLVAVWLIYRLIPFVPSLDFQLIKDSVKPLFHLQWTSVSVIHDLTAWLVVAYLLRQAREDFRLDKYFGALIVSVFCLEVLIVDNSIDLSNVVGAVFAFLLWRGISNFDRWHEGVLVLLISLTLLLTGFAPFELLSEPIPFEWLPFRGFLGGSMYLNTQSAAEKVFLYGSMVYIMWRTGIGAFAGVLISVTLVTMVEFAQTRFYGHTPEITDPLLVVFAAIGLLLLETQDRKNALGGPRDLVTHSASRTRNTQWVHMPVRFRQRQLDFLVELSEEMGVSVSGATRRIVTTFIDGLDNAEESRPRSGAGSSPAAGRRQDAAEERWLQHTVNLRRSQFRFLDQLAQEMGVGVSSVTQRIVAEFIDDLERE